MSTYYFNGVSLILIYFELSPQSSYHCKKMLPLIIKVANTF
ncbi:hypothetical protein P20311_1096 [Pseudoalteromonas sp. BSi20311]|nr:hypothetical protein P20311_1096 [Pseudoalteromonas sp. BSi20311]